MPQPTWMHKHAWIQIWTESSNSWSGYLSAGDEIYVCKLAGIAEAIGRVERELGQSLPSPAWALILSPSFYSFIFSPKISFHCSLFFGEVFIKVIFSLWFKICNLLKRKLSMVLFVKFNLNSKWKEFFSRLLSGRRHFSFRKNVPTLCWKSANWPLL